ncbi:MAG: response regulator [Syntrophorhabdaceae bacterium]
MKETIENHTLIKKHIDIMDRDSILIVDDQEWIDETLEEMLRREGFSEISHMNPELALKFFEANHQTLGLAIVGSTMPEMTGVELSRRFLAIDPEVPVILGRVISFCLPICVLYRIVRQFFLNLSHQVSPKLAHFFHQL